MRDHLHDAITNYFALLAERRDFGRRARRFAQAGAHAVQLALEPRGFVDRAGALGAQRVDHADELTDFFFEAIYGLQISRYGATSHRDVPYLNRTPCSAESALTMASTVPARLLGLDDMGAIAVGNRAELVVLDDDLRVAETWIGGIRMWWRD